MQFIYKTGNSQTIHECRNIDTRPVTRYEPLSHTGNKAPLFCVLRRITQLHAEYSYWVITTVCSEMEVMYLGQTMV